MLNRTKYLIIRIFEKNIQMAAPTGNQFWKLRAKHGRDKLFATPELLWDAACEYFQWCEDNPLYETKGFAYQGIVTKEKFPKMRAMTMSGLCFYLRCNEAYFRQFQKELSGKDDKLSKGFSTVIREIEDVIYNQKFQGAAADLLNANIIARDLGLTDRSEVKSTVDLGGQVNVNVTSDKNAKKLKEFLNDRQPK